jgi:SAM-dependent methyltransferase
MLSNARNVPGPSALLIRVKDRALHPYMQQYPFCTGPDEVLNRACFAAVLDSIEMREAGQASPLEELRSAELTEAPGIATAACAMLSAVGLSESAAQARLESRAWKMCLVPAHSECALALGCGEGDEIAALRARLPYAQIEALDWVEKITPRLLNLARAEFDHGNFDDLLAQRSSTFDLVFSNHVIEHSFNPDALLKAILECLKPEGWLVGALPLDGEQSDPLFMHVLALALEPCRIRRSDMFAVNAGHPYKTNASELVEALMHAGFRSARVAYRPWHPTLFDKAPAGGLDAARSRSYYLHRMTMGHVHGILGSVLSDQMPLRALRILGAVESRVPFGMIRMRARNSLEAIIIAQK